jgi:hypothetical protein
MLGRIVQPSVQTNGFWDSKSRWFDKKSRVELPAVFSNAVIQGFSRVETEEMPLPRFPAHTAGFAGFVKAEKADTNLR